MSRPTRRDLLRWAGASAAVAAAVPFAARTRTAAAAPAGSAKNLILVVAQGGWDTSYALDPKPGTNVDVPAGTVRRFGELDLWVDPSRANVTTFFERSPSAEARLAAAEAQLEKDGRNRGSPPSSDLGLPPACMAPTFSATP